MAKAPLLSLPRPHRPAHSRTFTDPEQPGVEVTLSLRRLDPCELAVAVDRAETFHGQYGKTGFPLLNGSAVPLALSVCQSLSMVELMQDCAEEDRYELNELVGMLANMPSAGMELLTWATELNGEVSLDQGNASRAVAP
jgi:hypothetical protein